MEDNKPVVRQRFTDMESELLADEQLRIQEELAAIAAQPAPGPALAPGPIDIKTIPVEPVRQRIQPQGEPVIQTAKNTNAVDTYMYLENATGTLEFDLINFREKGKQIKYFSILLNTRNENNELIPTAFSLDDESFTAIKKFFSQLEWNS